MPRTSEQQFADDLICGAEMKLYDTGEGRSLAMRRPFERGSLAAG
jgi:hypothetical protein